MSGTFLFAGVDGASDEMRRSRTAGNLERLKARLAAKRGLLPSESAGQPGGHDAASGVIGHQRDEEDEFEKALRNCRQDNDYIYLGIDATDDDWKSIKKRGKSAGGRVPSGGGDQTWNPKGVSLKNVNKGEQRPQREGVKREIMESILAESTKFEPDIVSTPDKGAKMPKHKGMPREKKDPAKVKPKKEVVHKIPTEPKVRRPGKKGMATAKQRLGKILKIHRMYH
ncbi:lysine-specific demethylase PHF2-like [Tropilaelaps mercedesae]|uniref:Lysine-specific demethylase PHF2-like n=1 Tax=Tropilaelaps mercedesae TaxID=418985 RepID=A0A1V9XBS6_9ACAR|nr:lysine-specific demethylase PHF2-like [Tropilaelaps mercedesae]